MENSVDWWWTHARTAPCSPTEFGELARFSLSGRSGLFRSATLAPPVKDPRVPTPDARDFLALLALGLIACGAWMIYPPAAPLVAGAILLALVRPWAS